jgi:hypothetical protein
VSVVISQCTKLLQKEITSFGVDYRVYRFQLFPLWAEREFPAAYWRCIFSRLSNAWPGNEKCFLRLSKYKKPENEKNIKIVVIETIIRRQIKGNSGRLALRRSSAAYTRISFRPELRFLKRVHPLLVLRGFKSYVPDADTQPENEWPFHDLETP